MNEGTSQPVAATCHSDERASASGLDEATLCPVSQTIGQRVNLITLKALLTGKALPRLEGKAHRFCPDPNCEVVYFSIEADSIFRKEDLRVRIGLKESEDPVPLCYCFDVTLADLRSDFSKASGKAIPARIADEVEAGHCACEVRNPQGTCCLGTIRRAVNHLNATAKESGS